MSTPDPQAIIEALQGTCQSPDDVARQFDCSEGFVLEVVEDSGKLECVLSAIGGVKCTSLR